MGQTNLPFSPYAEFVHPENGTLTPAALRYLITGGRDGAPGPAGKDGVAGLQGPAGIPGPSGPMGPQGLPGSGGGGGGLADPGANGLIKRTGLNLTGLAIAGTDYQSPLIAGLNITIAGGVISASGGGGGDPTSLDFPPVSPDPMDDEFLLGTLNPKWITNQTGVNTQRFSQGRIFIKSNPSAWITLMQAKPSGARSFKMKVEANASPGNNWCGFALTDGTRFIHYGYGFINGNWALVLEYLNGSVWQRERFKYNLGQVPAVYLTVEDDGTNLLFGFSLQTIFSTSQAFAVTARAEWLADGGNSIGIIALGGEFAVDWFRRTA